MNVDHLPREPMVFPHATRRLRRDRRSPDWWGWTWSTRPGAKSTAVEEWGTCHYEDKAWEYPVVFLKLNWKSQWFYRLKNERSWEYHGNIMIMVMIMILHKIWFPREYSGYDWNKQWFLMLYYGWKIRKIRKNSLDKLERPHCDVAGMTGYGLGELSPAEAFPGLWSPNWLKCKVGGNHHFCERMKGKTLVSYGFLQTFSRPILWSALVSINPMPLILNTSQKPSFSRGFTHIWDHLRGV